MSSERCPLRDTRRLSRSIVLAHFSPVFFALGSLLVPSLASGVLLYFSGSDSLPSRVEPVRMPRGSCTRSLCASVAFFRFLVSEGSGRGSVTMERKKYGHHLYCGAHNASCGSLESDALRVGYSTPDETDFLPYTFLVAL